MSQAGCLMPLGFMIFFSSNGFSHSSSSSSPPMEVGQGKSFLDWFLSSFLLFDITTTRIMSADLI